MGKSVHCRTHGLYSRMPGNTVKSLAEPLVAFAAHRRWALPFALLLGRALEDFGDKRPARPDGRPALLALQAHRFRGELDLLAQHSGFRILTLPFNWQMRLLMLFYTPESAGLHLLHPLPEPRVAAEKKALRGLLVPVLRRLYARFNIVATLGAAVHYWRDVDWGAASRAIGCPYIVLHRENLITRQAHADFLQDRLRQWGKFEGDFIITHNEPMRRVFIESGFAREDQVAALGAMRMDRFIRRLAAHRRSAPAPRPRKLVVFFSFAHGAGLFPLMQSWSPDGRLGLVTLFGDVHAAIVRLAMRHPEVDFVIKAKWGGVWYARIDDALHQHGLDRHGIANLQVTDAADVHQLILEASVVVGYGSTSLLEAAIAGKPVILPVFGEARMPRYAPYVPFGDRTDLFDIADSAENLERLIAWRLQEPNIAPDCQEARNRTFERLVSNLKGDAVERYVRFLTNAVQQPQPEHGYAVSMQARSPG